MLGAITLKTKVSVVKLKKINKLYGDLIQLGLKLQLK